jgi:transcriptional regulator with XRE-family HTH domain
MLKMSLVHMKIDFKLASATELRQELGRRLKAQRLAQGRSQLELAERAGLSKGAVQNLENKGIGSLDSLMHIVIALNLSGELQGLFALRQASIADLRALESASRQRAPRKRKSA